MNATAVVVDTNILYAALVSGRARLRKLLMVEPSLRLYSPRFLFVELFKHKERLQTASSLAPEDLLELLDALLAGLHFVNESVIPLGTWLEARRLCRDVDEKDTPFVALTLYLDAQLWTEDEELKRGLRAKGWDRFYQP